MAVYEDREAFIPYRRSDLIDMCLEEGHFSPEEAQKFRQFCEILTAYYHFEFHRTLEVLKDNFAPYNPDRDTKPRTKPTPAQLAELETNLVTAFKTVLESANYNPLSEADLQRAFEEESLVELKTQVDFDDFEQMLCYHRGDVCKITTVKKFFRKVERTIDVFERVVLLLKFKDTAYFAAKKIKIENLDFTPGKMYIYLYKNIPKYDLELLFPNIKISMTWKDRLLFGVPAVGAAVPVIIKALPQLLLVIGVILFFTLGPSVARDLGADEEAVHNIMPVLVALLSVVVALGGFAFKQYTNYKNKQIKFQKSVTDTLFFRNLDSNAGVFQALIDAAEEEVSKEIILVYYHLLAQQEPLTAERLDNRIEQWMAEKFGTKIDFDINDPLGRLEIIRGKLIKAGQDETSAPELSLLRRDEQGFLHVLPLDSAKTVLDYVWDNLFRYHVKVSVQGVG